MSRPHVLVARLDHLGDVLLAGPAVRAAAAGARRVTFLAGPRGAAAAAALLGVDDVVVAEVAWVHDGPVDPAAVSALVDDLAGRGIDQAAVLTSYHQSPLPTALLLRLAGIPELAAVSVEHAGGLLDHRLQPPEDDRTPGPHEVERALAVVEALGHRLPEGDAGRLALADPPAPARPFDARPYVVVHPGASVPARAWTGPEPRRLVDLLTAAGWGVAVTGDRTEAARTAEVAGPAQPSVLDLGGRLPALTDLASVLAGAEVVVTGNTGPAHLAAALGTPVVSVFAPTVPAGRWRPWGVPAIVLGDHQVPCAGCRAADCPLPEQRCLTGVTADSVLGAVEALAAVAPFRPALATAGGWS